MASKVPKFGAWEGGENFTVYFDNARKTRTGGPKINPNDPEENPDLFRLNGYAAQAQAQAQVAPGQARSDQQRKQTKVPHFGAWENEETAGYTVCFENVRNTRNGGPPVAENEPQMNRDMPYRPGPSAQAQAHAHGQAHAQAQAQNQAHARAQAQAIRNKVETKGGRPKVPEFGDWESERGDGYTQAFDLLKKGRDHPKPNAPQSNRDVGPTPQEARPKVPKFGDWEDGEGVQYTTYFEKAKDGRNLRPGGLYSTEPQMNREIGDSDAGSQAASSVSGSERQSRPSVAQAPAHPRANLQHRNGPTRGNQAGSIPQFGGWNNDPSQAKEYTDAFTRGKDDRHAPVNYNAPPPYQHQHRQPQPKPQPQPQPQPQPAKRQPHSSKQKQPGCCTIM